MAQSSAHALFGYQKGKGGSWLAAHGAKVRLTCTALALHCAGASYTCEPLPLSLNLTIQQGRSKLPLNIEVVSMILVSL